MGICAAKQKSFDIARNSGRESNKKKDQTLPSVLLQTKLCENRELREKLPTIAKRKTLKSKRSPRLIFLLSSDGDRADIFLPKPPPFYYFFQGR